MANLSLLPLYLLSFAVTCNLTTSDNIFDALDENGCKHFKAIIVASGLTGQYKGGNVAKTVFAFSDDAYNALPPSRRGNLYENTERGPRNYVQSFTLDMAVDTSSFTDAKPFQSDLNNNGYLFLSKRQILSGNVASGTAGVERYFVNGAMIVKENIKKGRQIIHIIDRVLDMPLPTTAISYAEDGNPSLVQFKFFSQLMKPLSETLATDSEENYSTQVRRILMSDQVTFFLPTDAAMNKIPSEKLKELVGNPTKLLEIIAHHIVPQKVIFTSMVKHNELFNTQSSSGRVIFRKNFEKEAVYVTGARKGGETVTALISRGNITVNNGVIHQIDEVLGFVYKSAIEEISTNVDTHNFERIITSARADLHDYLTMSNGVTVFCPTNNAMRAISNVYDNYVTNQSLINRVLQLSLLTPGTPFSLTAYNAGYNSMKLETSRYNGRQVKVYSEGNDTWVEGGYVKARVIKPDIGVTNGIVHIIDAVFGIPTRDIVYTIFCNDWLLRAYDLMVHFGLDKYMRDSSLVANQQCSFRSGTSGSSVGVPNEVIQDYSQLCGEGYHRCEFTVFVPNGTAVDNFLRTQQGRDLVDDPKRMRWILRRHISRRQKIYLDQIALGAPFEYTADNGEIVYIEVSGQNSLPSSQRTAYIYFEGRKAEIIRSDLGATNGVIHIIDDVMATDYDFKRDVSRAEAIQVPILSLVCLVLCSIFLQKC